MADVISMYKDAFRLFAAGDLEGAIAAYLAVIEANPEYGLAYQGLSGAYARHGNLDLAIDAIRRAIEIEPNEPLYLTSLSRFLQRQGKIPEAEEAAARALQLQQARRG